VKSRQLASPQAVFVLSEHPLSKQEEITMTEETKVARVFWRKGKKTMLCPLEITDAPVIYRGINNPDAYSFLLNTDPKGLGFEEDWIKSKQKPNAILTSLSAFARLMVA
jgi:hypothetical protein